MSSMTSPSALLTAVEVDSAAPRHRFKRGAADGARARAGVERDQNEPGDVAPSPPISRDAHLHLAIAPGGTDHPRGLGARQPTLTFGPLLGQHHLDDL